MDLKGNINSMKRNTFNVGDTVYPINKTGDNLPLHATQHINSLDDFEVIKINQKGKIDIGCFRYVNGKKKVFYFSTNRFSSTEPSEDEIDFNFDVPNTEHYQGNQPSDFYFAVHDKSIMENEDDVIYVYLTTIEYFQREGCVDDGSPEGYPSDDTYEALDRADIINSDVMDSTYEVSDWRNKTVDEITQSMIEQGFVASESFTRWCTED